MSMGAVRLGYELADRSGAGGITAEFLTLKWYLGSLRRQE